LRERDIRARPPRPGSARRQWMGHPSYFSMIIFHFA
jgi:hypothetical protein